MRTNYLKLILLPLVTGLVFSGIYAQDTTEKKQPEGEAAGSTDAKSAKSELIEQASYHYGKVEVGDQKKAKFFIYNKGTKVLKVNGITNSNSTDFTVVNPKETDIQPGEKAKFKINFHPKSKGFKSTKIVVTSNDEENQNVTFLVVGTGKDATGEESVAKIDAGKATIKVTVIVEEKTDQEQEMAK